MKFLSFLFFSYLFSCISPKSFVPGISYFYEDGGHATITLKAKNLEKDSDVVELYEKGNGLQFIKVGAEVIRLSKAIDKGNIHIHIDSLLLCFSHTFSLYFFLSDIKVLI